MIVEVKRVSTFNLRNLLGHDAPEGLIRQHLDCIRRSTVIWLGTADGVDACAVGLIPATFLSDNPYLWMIHTKICEQHPLRFIRWSRKVMDEALELYPTLIGLCDCDNIYGRRWLEWLGARFDGSRSYNGYLGFKVTR